MLFILLLSIAYLLGSLSSAIGICKLSGLPDPRTQGSGNPGATNVLRMGSKKLAILVLLGDILKGVLPVLLAKMIGLPEYLLGWIAFAAFIGHLFPVFFGFRGGKGVATAAGALLALNWPLALAVIVTWIFVVFIFRYSSLAALVAAITAPIYGIWLLPQGAYLPVFLMCVVLIIRHYGNIQRLLKGTESKIFVKEKK